MEILGLIAFVLVDIMLFGIIVYSISRMIKLHQAKKKLNGLMEELKDSLDDLANDLEKAIEEALKEAKAKEAKKKKKTTRKKKEETK